MRRSTGDTSASSPGQILSVRHRSCRAAIAANRPRASVARASAGTSVARITPAGISGAPLPAPAPQSGPLQALASASAKPPLRSTLPRAAPIYRRLAQRRSASRRNEGFRVVGASENRDPGENRLTGNSTPDRQCLDRHADFLVGDRHGCPAHTASKRPRLLRDSKMSKFMCRLSYKLTCRFAPQA